jgi:hypothetical protein
MMNTMFGAVASAADAVPHRKGNKNIAEQASKLVRMDESSF